MAIAFASKNQVQVHIMKSFYDLLHYGIKENLQALWEEPTSLPLIRRQHQGIFAVDTHDPEAAAPGHAGAHHLCPGFCPEPEALLPGLSRVTKGPISQMTQKFWSGLLVLPLDKNLPGRYFEP